MCFRLLRLAALPLLLLCFLPPAAAGPVLGAELRGAVSPASAAHVERALAEARRRRAELFVLALDTPGGLDSAVRTLVQGILASPVPVAVFVYPGGARAASAGTFLLYAAHVAAMAPGTNLGAATPVAVGGPGGRARPAGEDKADSKSDSRPDAVEAKAMHDAAAYLRSLAQLRGRNAEWAERAVREAASLSAAEALQLKVVDVLAPDLPELLRRLDGRRLRLEGGERVLALAGAAVVPVERWRARSATPLPRGARARIVAVDGLILVVEAEKPGEGK